MQFPGEQLPHCVFSCSIPFGHIHFLALIRLARIAICFSLWHSQGLPRWGGGIIVSVVKLRPTPRQPNNYLDPVSMASQLQSALQRLDTSFYKLPSKTFSNTFKGLFSSSVCGCRSNGFLPLRLTGNIFSPNFKNLIESNGVRKKECPSHAFFGPHFANTQLWWFERKWPPRGVALLGSVGLL